MQLSIVEFQLLKLSMPMSTKDAETGMFALRGHSVVLGLDRQPALDVLNDLPHANLEGMVTTVFIGLEDHYGYFRANVHRLSFARVNLRRILAWLYIYSRTIPEYANWQQPTDTATMSNEAFERRVHGSVFGTIAPIHDETTRLVDSIALSDTRTCHTRSLRSFFLHTTLHTSMQARRGEAF